MTKEQIIKLLKASLQPSSNSGYNAFTAYIDNQGPGPINNLEVIYSLEIVRLDSLHFASFDRTPKHLVTVKATRNAGLVFSGTSVEELSL